MSFFKTYFLHFICNIFAFCAQHYNNRYVRYKNIAAHNNLRDVYLRDIALSDSIKSVEISYGLRKAKG